MGLRAQIENMTFNPTEPVDAVFTEIEDFADIAESINDPITTVQKCKLAYIVLQNTKMFKSGLKNGTENLQTTRLGTISKLTSEKYRNNFDVLVI